ncbi:uncharacterized protein [Heterodontus francisci]|uniref:uncharacterized protein n=1 Tax=Heterodontus francisci TaxID=7792 RepID=UPI00355ADFF4
MCVGTSSPEEALYDNVKHEIVPVLVNISGMKMPGYCTEQARNMYSVLSKIVMQQAADAMGATRFRGQDQLYRTKRGIVNDVATRFNTGASIVNSLDILEKMEHLKGGMKGLLKRAEKNQEDQTNLGEEGTEIQLDGITILEAHARTVNHLIDREKEDAAKLRQGQLSHAYGLWMVGQTQHNLDQIQRGEVPDWIDTPHLARLAGRKGTLDNCTPKGPTRVYPVIPDCEMGKAYQLENIGVLRGNTSLRYYLTETSAIPHGMQAEGRHYRTDGCVIEIIPAPKHFARTGYGGKGKYCVSTTGSSYRYNNLQCPIPFSNFCFTPLRPVNIGQARIIQVRRRGTKIINVTDHLHDHLQDYKEPEPVHIPHLAEVLRELRLRVGQSVKLYYQLQTKIKKLEKDTDTELQDRSW